MRTNVLELATTMTCRRTISALSAYESGSVSKLIRKDLNRVLAHHHPEIGKISLVHFVDSQIFSDKINEKSVVTPSSLDIVDNHQEIPRISQTASSVILNQIITKKIGFEFMTNNAMKTLLTAVFSVVDNFYIISDIHEALAIFNDLIVAQTIFALRYCSLSRQESSPQQPCLAVSTLFLRPPLHRTSTFSVYRLIALPTVLHGGKYTYSNLPTL
ncbi:unnamed protein product [Rotaria magnacalcarata]